MLIAKKIYLLLLKALLYFSVGTVQKLACAKMAFIFTDLKQWQEEEEEKIGIFVAAWKILIIAFLRVFALKQWTTTNCDCFYELVEPPKA